MGNSKQNNMFINLISGRPANIAKALRFGRKFVAAGWRVTLSINMDAVVVAIADGDPGNCPVTGQPLGDQLQAFLDEGGLGLVGNECLKLAGVGPEGMVPGLGIAEFSLMQELMATPDLKIITW